jgi:hypothetical protein
VTQRTCRRPGRADSAGITVTGGRRRPPEDRPPESRARNCAGALSKDVPRCGAGISPSLSKNPTIASHSGHGHDGSYSPLWLHFSLCSPSQYGVGWTAIPCQNALLIPRLSIGSFGQTSDEWRAAGPPRAQLSSVTGLPHFLISVNNGLACCAGWLICGCSTNCAREESGIPARDGAGGRWSDGRRRRPRRLWIRSGRSAEEFGGADPSPQARLRACASLVQRGRGGAKFLGRWASAAARACRS